MFGYFNKSNVTLSITETYEEDIKVVVKAGDNILVTRYVTMMSIPAFQEERRARTRYQIENAQLREKLTRYVSRPEVDNGTSSIWHVLGCMPTTSREVVEKAYRKMALVYHPDHGGTSVAFQTLTKAKEKALAKCK